MTTIDDALKEWDEKYHFKPLRGRKSEIDDHWHSGSSGHIATASHK